MRRVSPGTLQGPAWQLPMPGADFDHSADMLTGRRGLALPSVLGGLPSLAPQALPADLTLKVQHIFNLSVTHSSKPPHGGWASLANLPRRPLNESHCKLSKDSNMTPPLHPRPPSPLPIQNKNPFLKPRVGHTWASSFGRRGWEIAVHLYNARDGPLLETHDSLATTLVIMQLYNLV